MISLFLNFESWIPKLIHGLLIISIIGTFASSIVSRIPFVGPYAHLVKAIATLGFVAAIFGEGYLYANRKWEIAVKEYQDKVAVAEQKAKDATARVEYVVIEKVKIVKEKVHENNKAIEQNKDAINAKCHVPDIARMLYNRSIDNEVSRTPSKSHETSTKSGKTGNK